MPAPMGNLEDDQTLDDLKRFCVESSPYIEAYCCALNAMQRPRWMHTYALLPPPTGQRRGRFIGYAQLIGTSWEQSLVFACRQCRPQPRGVAAARPGR